MFRSLLNQSLSAVLLSGLALGAAQAAPNKGEPGSQACSFSDLSGVASGGFACSGFLGGNLLNAANAGTVADVLSALSGSAWTSAQVKTATTDNKIELGSGQTVDFAGLLYGQTLIGVHKGNAGSGVEGTAFYYFDAGTTGLDRFNLMLAGGSNAVLYSTGVAPVVSAVPEPQSYALLLAGLGAVGFIARRRARG